ncbi:hypothetical protein [Nannocystis pusilla]|uniref:Uncharacterized protein n=1 Tax=Nannocystis pusilla TaxID=889268 RepID=A0ABS7TZ67_9BACT|nr:hypothetical protein [Nannocystis pusilla]MBZ5713572.1 hypothetical protein [Nannocystis pusilla]
MSPRPRRLSPSQAALSLALALSLSLPATAAAAPVSGKGSVLTLEGDDAAKAAALTKALQTEFAARGVGGGRDMSLSELKMTMGCDEPPSPKCLADGGRTLGVDNMVYGTLSKSGGGFVVQLNLLDVAGANVKEAVTAEYPASALEAGQVQATAKDLVGRVLGAEKAAAPSGPVAEPEQTEPEPQPDRSKLVWGRYKEQPTWKKAGLAASASVAVLAFGASLGLFMAWRKPNGPVFKKMLQLAQDSYTQNDNPDDNVRYGEGEDICANARAPLGNGVTNAAVANQCTRGEQMAKATTGLLVVGGIALASTIAFTTLMFVHRETPTMAKLRKRGFNFGAAPTFSGVMFGGGINF